MTGLLSEYQKHWFRFDAVAGLTTAAVVIPQSMAYASIAGLPVQAGLYVALVPMFAYALLGTSRQLSVSSTSTLAILTATELTLAVPGGDSARLMTAASTLALLVGGFLIAAGLLRVGFLANFISDPVLTGFKAGIGLVILVDQLPKLLGVQIERGHFFHKALSTLAACAGDESRDADSGCGHARDPPGDQTVFSVGSRSTRGCAPGCRSRRISGAEGRRCRADRSYSGRNSSSCGSGLVAYAEPVARRAGYGADVLH